MSLWTSIQDPLRGKTSLAKVFWVYGLLGSVLVSAIGLVIDSGNVFAMRVYTVFGLLFSVYVTIATYQCAGNCGSKSLAQFVRISAVISLVLLPVVAYLELSGALDLALANLNGEL
jgi:succinate-acetate transporter protein